MALTLWLPGEPGPKGSRTLGRRKDGAMFLREDSAAGARWQAQVRKLAEAHSLVHGTLAGPYAIELTFFFVAPRRSRYGYPARLDLDKLVRATLDALVKGQVLTDDRHVVSLSAHKTFGPVSGCEAHISCCSTSVSSRRAAS